jgi:hypothetical protein
VEEPCSVDHESCTGNQEDSKADYEGARADHEQFRPACDHSSVAYEEVRVDDERSASRTRLRAGLAEAVLL